MPEEIARLYDRYAAGLYRYALVVLADHGLAEDAVQQVFSRLQSAKDTRPLMMPDRYLRRAVRNLMPCRSIRSAPSQCGTSLMPRHTPCTASA